MQLASSLGNWRRWGLSEKPVLVKTFTSGQNHDTGLIEAADQRYVLKVFRHSFKRAMAAERLANQLDVSPKLIYADSNIALFEYIESPAKLEITLLELAQTLTKVHSSNAAKLEKFDLLKAHNNYLSTADGTTKDWHRTLLPALNEFLNDQTPWCFCHNDLVQENCLIADKLYLIDWEFAQQHNPWFDLAAVIIYFKLGDQDAGDFLNLYKAGWHQKMRTSIFYSSQVALLWTDLLWNMNKFGNDYRDRNWRRFEQLRQLASNLGIRLASQA